MLPIPALAGLARHGGTMIGRALTTATLLMMTVGCSSIRSPEEMWTDAAAEWTKPGATADERLQDYQECHRERVDASTRSGRFQYRRYGRRTSNRLDRLGTDDPGGRAAKRYFVLDECMTGRGWKLTGQTKANNAW
jgi:hypothetical protein